MNMIKQTLKLTLILYLCVALSGVYVLSASARITPKEVDEETTLITIEKGDTLWDLCEEHLKDPLRWRELSKYNDFTNPDLIFPGEKVRIPISMMNDIIENGEEKLKVNQEELDKLRSELEESESERKKLEDQIKNLKDSTAKLEKQIADLKASLQSQEKLLDAFKESTDAASAEIRRAIRNSRNALQEKIEEANGKLDSSNEMLTTIQKDLKATQEHIAAVQGDVKTLLAQVEANQKAISELKVMLEDAMGVHEEVSSTKRALVVVTTVAAGIGWFVLNAIGGRSGE